MKYHTLFFRKLGKMSQNVSSAAVVIGSLRVKVIYIRVTQCQVSASGSKVLWFYFKLCVKQTAQLCVPRYCSWILVDIIMQHSIEIRCLINAHTCVFKLS